MPPPPKRKWHPRKPNGAANGSTSAASTNPSTPTTPSSVAQQPKRPKVGDAASKAAGEGAVDVKHMYSTSAGGGSAKPFAALSGTLDRALLDGLDKMGFEYDVPCPGCVRAC